MRLDNIGDSLQLARRLNGAGAGYDAWFLLLVAGQEELVDWRESGPGQVVLRSGRAAVLAMGQWMPVRELSTLVVDSDAGPLLVIGVDYRAVWVKTAEGVMQKVCDHPDSAREAYEVLVAGVHRQAMLAELLHQFYASR